MLYAPKGDTSVTYVVGGTRQKLSMISTVTNQGKTSWMIIDGNFNHVRLIEFFEARITGSCAPLIAFFLR
jgi:hypothetical protein